MRTPGHLLAFAAGLACAWALQPAQAHKDPPPGLTPQIVTFDKATYRRTPSDKAGIAELARGDNAYIGRLDLVAGGAVPEHQDPTEEYIHVLQGTGQITINGVQTAIAPGTTVFMPAGATVSYANGDTPLVALQVFAGPSSADKYSSWPVSDQPVRHTD
jgi:quercetin dioxygenase-like cupin family protein